MRTTRRFLDDEPKTIHTVFLARMNAAWWPGPQKQLNLDLFRMRVQNDALNGTDSAYGVSSSFSLLRKQPLLRIWAWPPGTHAVKQTCSRGTVHKYAGPLQFCLTVPSLNSYLYPQLHGPMLEEICILDWRSERDRMKLRRKHKHWWHDTFDLQLRQHQREGKISDVEHWYFNLEHWSPFIDSLLALPAQPRTARSRLLAKLCF